jgi:O-antigen/teichoic acid export membrane protein
MSRVRRNIVANVLGKGASALFTLIFVPLHLKYLGVEAYGLVGFYAAIQTMFLLIDMGFSGAFTREIARLSVSANKAQEMRDLCRTFEVGFLLIGSVAAFLIVVLAQPIASYWVNSENISTNAIAVAIGLMGVSIGLQFPFMIYQGGLLGLQRQSILSGLNIVAGLLRGLGGLLVLMFIDPSISAFFAWQVVVSIFQLFSGRFFAWQSLPQSQHPSRFDFGLVVPLWRFAAGMAGIAVCSMILMQADKLILSRMITLEQFGYYSLASMVAGIPFMLAGPINNAVYPRLNQLVALEQVSELAFFYHRACQITAVLVIPAGLFLAIFSNEFMLFWTGNPAVAQNTYQLVSILAIGSMLLAIMYIPYALQLAFSWTKLALHFNILSIIILIPSMIWLTNLYGAIGACFVWLILNVAYVLGMIQLMHQRILPNEKLVWYRDDVAKPFFSVLLIMAISKLIVDPAMPKLGLVLLLIVTILISTFAAALSAPLIRAMVLARWSVWRSATY